MVAQFDEKGKKFTPVITKEPVTVTIQTVSNVIRGSVYIRPETRVKDELNDAVDNDHFLAVTDAIVYNSQDQEIFRSNFLVVNISHIVWVIPENELSH
jgi:hypothetical protein